MARDHTISSISILTCMALSFILLVLVFHTTTAIREHSIPLNEIMEKKSNVKEFATRRHGIGNSKSLSTRQSVSTATSSAHVRPLGQRRIPGSAHRTPLLWHESAFNSSAHEVPSGPNPISNR